MSTQKLQEFTQKSFYIILILPERWGCGSHILCSVLCIMTLHTNANPKCASRSAKLISIDSACGCNRGSLRYSQAARYEPQMYRKNGQYETLRTSDITQSSIESCKLVCKIWMFRVCNAISFGVQNVCSYVPCNMHWCAQRMFVCTMW